MACSPPDDSSHKRGIIGSAPVSAAARFAIMLSDWHKRLPLTDLQQIIHDLERQRAAIETALAALRGLSTTVPQRRGPGRPPGKRGPGRPPKKRSNISEEGRQRIAEALRKRWAAKKAAAKKTDARTTGSGTSAATKKAAPRKSRKKEPVEVRIKLFWGVFNQSLKRVALYEFNQKKQAEEKAEALSASGKSPHFVKKEKMAIDA